LPKFNYKAKKGLNETVSGSLEADNHDEALNKVTAQGLFPIEVNEVAAPAAKASGKSRRKKKISKKISSKEVLTFTQKMTTLVRAKVELLASLKILYEQTENARFKEVILEIYNLTKEGKAFSEGLMRFPRIFPPLYVSIVKAGEVSGRLDSALEQISDFSERDENLRTKIQVALAYPTLLVFVGAGSIFILMNFVVPKLKPIFEGIGRDLPLITKIVLQISELSNKTWWIILGAGSLVIFILYRRKGSDFFKHFLTEFKTHMPILKRLTKNQEMAHFSRALALLIKSGVPALRSLEIATFSVENAKLKKGLEEACKNVASGQTLSRSMETLTTLPNFFTKMVAVGEESGRLAEVLDETSHSYIQQVEYDITLITSLLEPIFILVLGVVLGTIVLSILLPTFQITQVIH